MNTPITTPIDNKTTPERAPALCGSEPIRAPHGRAKKGMPKAEDKALRLFDDKAIRPEGTK